MPEFPQNPNWYRENAFAKKIIKIRDAQAEIGKPGHDKAEYDRLTIEQRDLVLRATDEDLEAWALMVFEEGKGQLSLEDVRDMVKDSVEVIKNGN